MPNIALLALENRLAEPLLRILRAERHNVTAATGIGLLLHARAQQIVFTSGDSDDYRETVRRLRRELPGSAVIVVNRCPDNLRWIDALDAGAADYCGAPFERVQIRWVIEGVLRGMDRARLSAAAA
jgi:DNA-binding response OmpR family regulator